MRFLSECAKTSEIESGIKSCLLKALESFLYFATGGASIEVKQIEIITLFGSFYYNFISTFNLALVVDGSIAKVNALSAYFSPLCIWVTSETSLDIAIYITSIVSSEDISKIALSAKLRCWGCFAIIYLISESLTCISSIASILIISWLTGRTIIFISAVSAMWCAWSRTISVIKVRLIKAWRGSAIISS